MSDLKTTVREMLNLNAKDAYGICDRLMSYRSQGHVEYYNARMFEAFGITLEFVDCKGGTGQGDIYYSVIKFSKGEESVLVKFNGIWTSYEGAQFQRWSFVNPKVIEVTIYE